MNTSIYDTVLEGKIGALTIGQDLRELSTLLPPPKGWIFPYEGPLDGVLDYGPMEVFIRSVADNVEIYLMKIHLFKNPGPDIIMRFKDSKFLRLRTPSIKDLEITVIESKLTEKGIKFSRNSQTEISSGARPYFEFNRNARMYFSGEEAFHLNYLEFCKYC